MLKGSPLLVTGAAVLCLGLSASEPASARGAADLLADDSTRPQVTIQGQRESEESRVRAFVSRSIQQPFADSLARWDRPICPVVVGFSPSENEIVRQRLKSTATGVGARSGAEGCAANLAVINTTDPVQVLKAWSSRDRYLFGDASVLTVNRLLKSELPVRVWYNVGEIPAAGLASAPGQLAPGGKTVNSVKMLEGSRITYNTVRAFSSVIIVIDRNHTPGFDIEQLADYAAVVGLAEIRESADEGGDPSILRLFRTEAADRPKELTPWDTSLLTALYHTDQSLAVQRSEIETRMINEVIKSRGE